MFKTFTLTSLLIFMNIQHVVAADCEELALDIENSLMTIAIHETDSDQNSAVRAAARLQKISNEWQKINATLLLTQIQQCTLDRGPLDFQKYWSDAMRCHMDILKSVPDAPACNRNNWGKEDD